MNGHPKAWTISKEGLRSDLAIRQELAVERREFITIVGAALAGWPLAAAAQQPKMPAIGYLQSGSGSVPAAFHAGLKETGFVEGQNVSIEYRKAEGEYDRLPGLAADLISRHVAVIVADGSIGSALAAREATTIVPIVFLIGADPVRTGLVASLSRPEGNITGATTFTGIPRKQLNMLRELVPNARAFAMLANPNNPTHAVDKSAWKDVSDSIGLPIETVSAGSEKDFEPAIASLADRKVDAVFVLADSLFGSHRRDLIAVLARHAMPAMFASRQNVVDGGLISYGGSRDEANRQTGIYAGRILKGDKPANLPVLQPTKFELVINLKTAKTLGINVPASLLALADEVIE
jgi:putative tryptophan/tyrosine transport system substrate-binding protein